ncbi:putative short-chain dehydrogenase [Xylaria cf. heliscus]|nr:putative short-chain dehydrogenase [Xylaria cf. heliscus]
MESFNGNTTGQEVVAAFSNDIPTKTSRPLIFVRSLGTPALIPVAVLITGASQGSLGSESAIQLASAKHLILVGRNQAKIQPVIDETRVLNPSGRTTFVQADLASNDSVRRAAAEINALPGLDHIDIVINSAGVMAVRPYQTSADGVELQFAANHLGHFLLTKLILGKILAARTPTIVNLSSMGYELGECNFEDPNFNDGDTYNPWLSYAQAKTANILHVAGLHDKYGDKGLATFAVHPGYVPDSQLQASNGVDMDLMVDGYKLAVSRNDGKGIPPQEPRTLQEGCATVLLAALDPHLRDKSRTLLFEGKVYEGIKEYAISKQNAKKLWDLSEKLTQ